LQIFYVTCNHFLRIAQLRKPCFRASNIPAQNLTQNGHSSHSRSRVFESGLLIGPVRPARTPPGPYGRLTPTLLVKLIMNVETNSCGIARYPCDSIAFLYFSEVEQHCMQRGNPSSQLCSSTSKRTICARISDGQLTKFFS